MFKHIEEISLIKMGEYRVPDFWNGYLKTMTSDALCYITDDVLFVEDTVESIIEEMISRFSTYDGIIGIEQYNLPSSQALQSAFGVIGTKYADRFPDRKVWCENYSRFFCDKELWLYANEIGKFHFSDKARLAHLHPAFTGEKPDYTHKQVRKHLSKDKETFRQRQEKNLLWGRDFTLLNM